MSYHYERGGYSGGFNRRGGGFTGPRINENEVPQSKHTIFIRGLGGEVTTDEIEEYIGERVGKIKFDFVKHTLDRTKIFVAVRFEKREEAKEFMDTYSERDFMGFRCDLSWFRDIRRYCAYKRSKQIRSNSQRRRRRSDSDESRKASESPERRSKSKESRASRSGSRNSRASKQSRSRSRSSDRARGQSRSRSRGSNRSKSSRRSRSRSRSIERRARSTSRSSRRADSRNDYDSSRERSDAEEEKRRNRDRQSRNKRRRVRSDSDSDDNKTTKRMTKVVLPQIPAPDPTTPAKPKINVFIPPPTVDMDVDTPKNSPPQHVNPYQMHQSFRPQEPTPQVQNTTYVVPIKEDAPPKPVIRDPAPQAVQNPAYPIPTHTAAFNAQPVAPIQPFQQPYPQVQNYVQPVAPVVVAAPPAPAPAPSLAPAPASAPAPALAPAPAPAPALAPAPAPAPVLAPAPAPAPQPLPQPVPQAQAPPPQPTFVPRQVGKIEILMPAALPATPPAPVPVPAPARKMYSIHSRVDITQLPSTFSLFGHLEEFETDLLSTIKYEPPVVKNEHEGLSTLRLSSMDTEDDDEMEDEKILERENKLASLDDNKRILFYSKKKVYEAAYRTDCETYAIVTRALLSKDESLKVALKSALVENMQDMYKKMMKRVDLYLNQLIA